MKQHLIHLILVCLMLTVFGGCGGKPMVYSRSDKALHADLSKTIVCVPVDTVIVDYVDKTRAAPDTVFPDSFYLESANTLLLFEISKLYNPVQPRDDSLAAWYKAVRYATYSKVAGDTADIESVSELVKKIAAASKASLVLVPRLFKVKHMVYQPDGWRGEGPSYQRPVTFMALGTAHIQIWDSQGRIMYEKLGITDAGRPVMYTLFGKRYGKKKQDDDVVSFAQHLYAPPMVRSLYMAIKESLNAK